MAAIHIIQGILNHQATIGLHQRSALLFYASFVLGLINESAARPKLQRL
jgi:hypothetical protein